MDDNKVSLGVGRAPTVSIDTSGHPELMATNSLFALDLLTFPGHYEPNYCVVCDRDMVTKDGKAQCVGISFGVGEQAAEIYPELAPDKLYALCLVCVLKAFGFNG